VISQTLELEQLDEEKGVLETEEEGGGRGQRRRWRRP